MRTENLCHSRLTTALHCSKNTFKKDEVWTRRKYKSGVKMYICFETLLTTVQNTAFKKIQVWTRRKKQ